MLRQIGRLYAAEMSKTWRTKFPYLGLLASALMALVARQSLEEYSQPGGITGASYIQASVNLSSTLIIRIFGTIYAAMLVASEAYRGTLRTILTRPVTRGEFLSAKLLASWTYLAALFAANIIPAIIVLLVNGYPRVAIGDEDVMIPGLAEQIAIFSYALLLTFLPLAATQCFAFCISALSANPATAVGVAIGLLLSIDTISHLFGRSIEPWVVSSYYDTAMGIASEKADGIRASWSQDKVAWLFGISAATGLIFTAIGFRSFLKRDLQA